MRNRTHPQLPRARAFTITELLVVITLIVILVLIAVPSFQAMIGSSEEALAQSQLQSALRAARDAAVRSNGAADGAAVFFFEPGGRTTIIPCVKVGEINDLPFHGNQNDSVRREIFAAAPGFSPVSLPRNWMVRAYASGTAVNRDAEHEWYGDSPATYSATPETRWVFPETGFFNSDANDSGYDRSTFMVRFQAGTGVLVGTTTEPALVLAPRRSLAARTAVPFSTFRADREGMQDPIGFVRQVLSMSGTNATTTRTQKQQLLGRKSSDMVLARPVMQLALYSEARMAAEFGARLDPETGCLYSGPTAQGGLSNYHAQYVPGATSVRGGMTHRITLYVQGDTNGDGATGGNDSDDRPEAKVFSVDRYTGTIRELEVQP